LVNTLSQLQSRLSSLPSHHPSGDGGSTTYTNTLPESVRSTSQKKELLSDIQFGNKFSNWAFKKLSQDEGSLATRMVNAKFKTFNMSLEDWMSRMNTLIAMYIPQIYINFKENALPWETVGRNVITWIATIALMAFTKNDKTSINSLFLNRFMKSNDKLEAEAKSRLEKSQKKGWLGRQWGQFRHWWHNKLPKGFDFNAADLMRANGMRVGNKGVSWSRLAFEQTAKLQRNIGQLNDRFGEQLKKTNLSDKEADKLKKGLSQFFEFFTHEEALLDKTYKAANGNAKEHGLIEFSRRISKLSGKYFKRISGMKVAQIAIQTAIFAFFIGDLVMRLVWATFSKLDHHENDAYSSRLDPNKKPAPVNIYGFRSLPARVIPSATTGTSSSPQASATNQPAGRMTYE
jgi:hypothetical protein